MTLATAVLIAFPVFTGLIAGALHYVFSSWKRDLTHCRHCDHEVLL